MLSLSDATALVQDTTDQLINTDTHLTPQAGSALIGQWLEPLSAAENTKPIADKLSQLKTSLGAPAVDEAAVQTLMGELAELISTMGAGMGSEGEMPSLLDGLASALRHTGQTAKGDA